MAEGTKGVVWDLRSFFIEFNGPEMIEFKKKLEKDVYELQKAARELGPLSDKTADKWEEVLLRAEDFRARLRHISSYVGCLSAADAGNEEYLLERGRLLKLSADFEKFDADVLRAFKDVRDDVFEAFISRADFGGAEHFLRRTRERAQYTMSLSEEKLAADLNLDGLHSWGRLYETITGKLEFDIVYPDGKRERKPISQWRALMASPDREIGRAAFQGGNEAWKSIEDVCAAALNAISGNRLTLYRYRGIDHFLDRALFQASITRRTLDAMYEAVHSNIDIAREIFRAKAGHMGREGIQWFEREAPLPLGDGVKTSWERVIATVGAAFDGVYPGLAEYYHSALDKRWIESEARPGKRPGAFCTGSPVTGEQRVYMNFSGTHGDLTTVAHEVGHAFHSHIIGDLRPMARWPPMTLAETASIFGERILAEGCYKDENTSEEQKLLMLDSELTSAAVLLLDITVRFEFEKVLYEERSEGEMSVSRLKEIMVEKQRRLFGDVMLEGGEDPYFWASKLHFYITHVTFYNFPYTFGFLLARALFARFRSEGASFLPKYEEFLRLSGSDTVEKIARRSMGVDVGSPAFWTDSIRSLEEPLELYRELLAGKS